MQISVYESQKGKPLVHVVGNTKDKAAKVAQAYKDAKVVLAKK